MPWGLTRFQRSGQSHFVTFCCYHRLLLLTTDESRRIFESGLERVRCSFRLSVYGYVVMPEHLRSLRSRGGRMRPPLHGWESNWPTQAKGRLEWALGGSRWKLLFESEGVAAGRGASTA